MHDSVSYSWLTMLLSQQIDDAESFVHRWTCICLVGVWINHPRKMKTIRGKKSMFVWNKWLVCDCSISRISSFHWCFTVNRSLFVTNCSLVSLVLWLITVCVCVCCCLPARYNSGRASSLHGAKASQWNWPNCHVITGLEKIVGNRRKSSDWTIDPARACDTAVFVKPCQAPYGKNSSS